MIAMKRFLGVAMVLALVPAMAAAQQHDMSKMGQDTAKKAPAAGMQHDMAGMKMDTGKMAGMKHDMSKMGNMSDSEMKAMMKGMKPSDEPKSGWKELDHFHALMQATWHGAMDNDLRPAKAMTADVVKGAEAWEKSKGPAKCDNAAARKELPGVTKAARAYADVVAKKGSDADVKASLRKVHDTFEKVAMPCMMAEIPGMKH